MWTCKTCGCQFSSQPGDEDVARCTPCVTVEAQAAKIVRLQACITEAVNLVTQDVCIWQWVHRMREESGLEPLREDEERQPIINAQTAEIKRLRKRLRNSRAKVRAGSYMPPT